MDHPLICANPTCGYVTGWSDWARDRRRICPRCKRQTIYNLTSAGMVGESVPIPPKARVTDEDPLSERDALIKLMRNNHYVDRHRC